MGGASKDLEAIWKRNKELRKKALSGKLSPQDFRSLPPQLRWPDKLHGFPRPEGLRGPPLVQWLMLLGEIWRDKRFDDCINAFLEHGIVKPYNHEFVPDKLRLELDSYNEHQKSERLAQVRALIEQGMDVRPACRKVAAEWALGVSLTAGEQQLRDQLRPPEAADQQ